MDVLTSVKIQQIYSKSDDFDICYSNLFGQEINDIDKSIYEDLKQNFEDAKSGKIGAYNLFVCNVQGVMNILANNIKTFSPPKRGHR